jgi:tetratricopeptide (TPR) repeat protein
MQEHLYVEAQGWYQQAIELAQSMLEEAMRGETHPDAIHPYVVSCHNRADVYFQLGNIQEAEAVLQQTYNQVVEIMGNSSLSDTLRFESFQALKMVAYEMNRFYSYAIATHS